MLCVNVEIRAELLGVSSPSSMCILRLELGLSGVVRLMASAFTHASFPVTDPQIRGLVVSF